MKLLQDFDVSAVNHLRLAIIRKDQDTKSIVNSYLNFNVEIFVEYKARVLN